MGEEVAVILETHVFTALRIEKIEVREAQSDRFDERIELKNKEIHERGKKKGIGEQGFAPLDRVSAFFPHKNHL
jgi:hypothetical protein